MQLNSDMQEYVGIGKERVFQCTLQQEQLKAVPPRPPFIHRCLAPQLPRANPPKAVHEVPLAALPHCKGYGFVGKEGLQSRQELAGAAGRRVMRKRRAAVRGKGGLCPPAPIEKIWHSPSAQVGAGRILPQNTRPWQTGSRAQKLPVPACLLKNTTPGVLRLRPVWLASPPQHGQPVEARGYRHQRSALSVKGRLCFTLWNASLETKNGECDLKNRSSFSVSSSQLHSDALCLLQCFGRNGRSNNKWKYSLLFPIPKLLYYIDFPMYFPKAWAENTCRFKSGYSTVNFREICIKQH